MPRRIRSGREATTLVAQTKAEGRRAPTLASTKAVPPLDGLLRTVVTAVESLHRNPKSAMASKRVRRRREALMAVVGHDSAHLVTDLLRHEGSALIATLAQATPEARPFFEHAALALAKLGIELSLDSVGARTEAAKWASSSAFADLHAMQAAKTNDVSLAKQAEKETERSSLCLERARQLQRAANDARREREEQERLDAMTRQAELAASDRFAVEEPEDDAPADDFDETDPTNDFQSDPLADHAPENKTRQRGANEPESTNDLERLLCRPVQARDGRTPAPVMTTHVAASVEIPFGCTFTAVDPLDAERRIAAANAASAKLIAEHEKHEAAKRAAAKPTPEADSAPKITYADLGEGRTDSQILTGIGRR